MKDSYEKLQEAVKRDRLRFRLSAKTVANAFLVAGLLGIQHFSFGFLTAQQERKRVFSEKFVEEKLAKDHQKYMG